MIPLTLPRGRISMAWVIFSPTTEPIDPTKILKSTAAIIAIIAPGLGVGKAWFVTTGESQILRLDHLNP